MGKRSRHSIMCRDCKVACSTASLCRCCVAIQADNDGDERDYLWELHAETERQRKGDIRDGRDYI
jgi:hypothetical protein